MIAFHHFPDKERGAAKFLKEKKKELAKIFKSAKSEEEKQAEINKLMGIAGDARESGNQGPEERQLNDVPEIGETGNNSFQEQEDLNPPDELNQTLSQPKNLGDEVPRFLIESKNTADEINQSLTEPRNPYENLEASQTGTNEYTPEYILPDNNVELNDEIIDQNDELIQGKKDDIQRPTKAVRVKKNKVQPNNDPIIQDESVATTRGRREIKAPRKLGTSPDKSLRTQIPKSTAKKTRGKKK